MASFRVRPKFQWISDLSVDEIITRTKEKLKDEYNGLHGQAMQDHITIRVDSDQRHYWSPQLSVLLQDDQIEGKTLITGVYGPMPNVWSLFALVYLAIAVLFTFISIVGFSQRALGEEAYILYALPFLIIAAVTMYIVSQFGQKLGAPQTYRIHYFFEEVLGEKLPEI